MKHFVLGIVALGLLFGAFVLGRQSTPQTQPDALQSELDLAFDNLVDAQRGALNLMKSQEFFDSSGQNRAEAYRGLLYSMVGALKINGLHDANYPRFVRTVDWAAKSGFDNPDNTYFVTHLRDDGEYLISGTRGTTTNLVFQLLYGEPGVADGGTSTNIDLLYADDLIVGSDGRFEILVSRTDPGAGKNWLQLDDGAKTLIVRYTHMDWQNEERGALTIRSLKQETALHKPALTEAEMAVRLNAAATALYDRNKSWIGLANIIWARAPRNVMTPPRQTPGGLVGQYSAFATFELAEDEALILTSHPTKADYQGIQLGNRWFVSLDYETRTSSMTPVQSAQNADGAYRYVISKRNPGVANWLDPDGHSQGLIMMRWQGKQAKPDQNPTLELVKFDEIASRLPPDTSVFSEEERRKQILSRQAAVKKRFP